MKLFKTKKDKKIEMLEEALKVLATELNDWECVKFNYPEHEDEECPEDCNNCKWHDPQKQVEWVKEYVSKKQSR